MVANLHQAAERGDLRTLRALLDAGADLDTKDGEGWTPLLRAAKGGSREVIELLLDRGAGLHATTPRLATALHIAVNEGHVEAARTLIARGIDLNAAHQTGITAIGRAVYKNRAELLQLLLEAGADPNLGEAPSRPLGAAITLRRRELARLLLKHGANANAADESGFGLLHQAVSTGDVEMAELLLEHGADPNGGGEMTPLVAAITMNRPDAVRLLLAHGAVAQPEGQLVSALTLADALGKAEIRDALHQATGTDLHEAAAQGSIAELARLLGCGDIDRRDERGRTALMCACEAGQAEAAELLLDKGAELEAVDQHGFTPLLYAVAGGQAATTELLLHRGARVDVQNQWGQTPLERAVFGTVPELVDLLRAAGAELDLPAYGGLEDWDEVVRRLEAGEPIDTQASSGMTVLMAAAARGNVEAIRKLAARGASLDLLDLRGRSALSQAMSHPPAVQALLKLGADPNAAAGKAILPLRLALMLENPELVRLLMQHGADIEAQDMFGHTPLAWIARLPTAKRKSGELAQVLCEAGARVDVRDSLGRTPLHNAVQGGLTDVVHVLLQHSADVNTRSEHGFTPLDEALVGHHPEIAQLLKARGGEATIPAGGALLIQGIQGYIAASNWISNFRSRWSESGKKQD